MAESDLDISEQGEPARPGLGVTIASVWAWFVFGACVAIWAILMPIVWVVTWPFDKARWWTGYLFRKLPVVHQHLNPLWRFRLSGRFPEDPRNPYVVVSNHESFVDILLISHLPWEMKWLSKREMFKLPVAGWLMKLARDIPLDRGDRDSASAAMELCEEALDRKVSVMVFPEGTRSASGEMRDFKDGAFRLAIDTQLPVLPLVVSGTRSALRKHDWRMGRANAEVRVLDPVPTEGLTADDVGDLRDRVRSIIEAERESMRASA